MRHPPNINFAHNPQTFVNGFVSGQRNMFLISSISVAIMGFAHSFVDSRYNMFVKIISMCVLLFSIVYGYLITEGFAQYVSFIKRTPKVPEPYVFLRLSWEKWIYLSYAYIAMFALLGVVVFFRKIKN